MYGNGMGSVIATPAELVSASVPKPRKIFVAAGTGPWGPTSAYTITAEGKIIHTLPIDMVTSATRTAALVRIKREYGIRAAQNLYPPKVSTGKPNARDIRKIQVAQLAIARALGPPAPRRPAPVNLPGPVLITDTFAPAAPPPAVAPVRPPARPDVPAMPDERLFVNQPRPVLITDTFAPSAPPRPTPGPQLVRERVADPAAVAVIESTPTSGVSLPIIAAAAVALWLFIK